MRSRFLLLGLCLAALVGLAGYLVFSGMPSIEDIPEHLNRPSIRITDRNGRPLYEILPMDGGRHAVVGLQNIPECMRLATIAVEDKNFYSNPGVDPEGMLRALWINFQGGETIAGGSTITQQVVRTILLKEELSERTLKRKMRESLLAWELTRTYSKDEILALYLNQTFYGGFAYGVEAAARTYFGKPASDLLLPECALLAGLPQAPALYNPFDHPDKAKERQLIVLGLMEKNSFINSAERLQASQTPLSYNAAPFPIRAPHFVWMVKNLVDSLEASGQIDPRSSLVVRTSLDLDAQTTAEQAVARQIAKFKDDQGLDHNVKNAAVVALDPRQGEVLALVGSADYFNPGIFGAINMATALRQPGSAFKPFIYAETFNPANPSPWTAATPILDVQTVFPAAEGKTYIPKNYDEKEHGIVPARVALASSLNIPAVTALQKAGVENVLRLAERLGITSLGEVEPQDLSLALGGGQMSLLELTRAYSAFANQGYLPDLKIIQEIRDADGRLLYEPPDDPLAQIFDPRVAWLISNILSDDNARLIGFGKNSTLKIERPAAVKTGTTTNYHDNWTIGYIPGLVVGVWVGNSDYQAMRSVNGLTGAAPIWQETLRGLLRGTPVEEFIRPDGLVQEQVCTYSGLLVTLLCDRTELEWFLEGTQPTRSDDVYTQIWLDATSGKPANAATPSDQKIAVTVLNLPERAQRWARSQGLRLLSDYGGVETQPAGLTLISPAPAALYRISAILDTSAQQLPVEALAGTGLTQVTLWVDGEKLGSFDSPPYVTWWALTEGRHHFWAQAQAADGRVVKSEIVEIDVTK